MNDRTWWEPGELAARKPNLDARMAVIGTIRRFFTERDFAEVETPALQVSPGLEPHLIAFETELVEPFRDGARDNVYLHTSPEFAMKKLLVAGEPRIYQLARCFRNGERSATHHPELRACLAAVPGEVFVRGDRHSDPRDKWQYLSVAEAFERHAGIDLLATTPDPGAPDAEALRAEAKRIGVFTNPNDTWEDVFFRVFLARIEAELGIGAPTVLYDYPASMAALSRIKRDDPGLAERFELYVCGLELANAFSELTDAGEQRRRFEADIENKRALSGVTYPIDEDFLAALDHGLPESAGIALGVDRLVMLATGAARIEDVLWAPVAAT
jgi:lysyl-tRNA synthetase class 2